MPNAVWASLIVIFLVSATIGAVLLHRKAALVLTIHNLIWASAIFLVGTDLIRFKESSSEAWIVLICSLLAFNVGSMFGLVGSDKTRPGSELDTYSPVLATRGTVYLLLCLYSASVTIYLVTISERFGLELLLTDPASIRSASGESYLESVPLLARLGLFIGPFLIAILGYKQAVRDPFAVSIRIMLLALIALSMLLLLQRTNIFMGVLWLMALYLSSGGDDRSALSSGVKSQISDRKERSKGRRILPVAVFAGVLLIGAFQLIGGALGKEAQQAISTGAVSQPLAQSGLTSLFGYYTGGIVAFLQLVDSTNFEAPPPHVQGTLRIGDYNPQTWGASTFAPLLKVVPLAEAPDSIAPFIDTGVLTNVYTWNEPFYRDFRAAGVVTGMLLLGFATSWMFLNRYRSPALFWIQSAALSTVFFATFVMKVNNTLFLAGVILVIAVSAFQPRVRRNEQAAIEPVVVRGGRLMTQRKN